uniref:Uncharacterized protein n=1 Tax=Alexandrium monilatum TaxID=311494 RepID=A0A7S4W937_9DINO
MAPPPKKPYAKKEKKPVVFWGILDIKFDPSKPVMDRVKILEAGDGRTSKFTAAGAAIKDRYDSMYRLEEGGDLSEFDLLAKDKKFLHDEIQSRGYDHLLPRQASFPREYTESLADEIKAKLGLSGNDHVVLKLCNRTRAAGVLLVWCADLDAKLKVILKPPPDEEKWLDEQEQLIEESNSTGLQPGTFKENLRHWWSNEHPIFIAERLYNSVPVVSQGRPYNGTLRVAFALRQRPRARQRGDRPSLMDVDWLGAYWKLPKKPLPLRGPGRDHECVISAARTSGSLPVDPAHCSEVYAALGGLLPRLFDVGARSLPEHAETLEKRYRETPVLGAYFMARFGAAKYDNNSLQVARTYLTQAEAMASGAPPGRSTRCFTSFLQRWWCIVCAQDQQKAVHCLRRSRKSMELNANYWFLNGVREFQLGRRYGAADSFRKCLALDPDFKNPYMYLGAISLQEAQWSNALEISQAGEGRHPSPHFKYHMGVALANLAGPSPSVAGGALGAEPCLRDGNPRKKLWQRALECLCQARLSPEGLRRKNLSKSPWHPYDDEVVDYLERQLHTPGGSTAILQSPTVRMPTCSLIGWTVVAMRA